MKYRRDLGKASWLTCFELHGLDYLVTTDHYSNFFEVDVLTSKTSKGVIDKLKPHLARYGFPDRITTDNGPQFDCREFQRFAEQYQRPRSNGKAENSVKTAKQIVKKAIDAGRDPQLPLLDFRNTPLEGMDSSPAQRLFSHRTRTSLPIASQLLQPQLVPDVGDKLQERKLKQLSLVLQQRSQGATACTRRRCGASPTP